MHFLFQWMVFQYRKKNNRLLRAFYTCCKNVISFLPKIDQDIRLENDINISEAPYMFFLSFYPSFFLFHLFSFFRFHLSISSNFSFIFIIQTIFPIMTLSEFLPFIFCFINLISSPHSIISVWFFQSFYSSLFAMNSFIFFLVFFFCCFF